MEESITQLYNLSEITYIKKMKDKQLDEIFPRDWYSIDDYDLKIKILYEAIHNDILIKDTDKYLEYKNYIK